MESCVERRSQQRRLGVRLNDESVVALLACCPSRPATLRSPALDTMTDLPGVKGRHRSRRSLRALAMARRATWRERATESFPVMGNRYIGEKRVSRRAVLPCRGYPERGMMTSQPPGIRGMSDYTRSVRSDVSGHASVGYVNSVNAPTVAPAVSATAQIGLDYVLGRTLTGSILDTFSYQNNGAVLAIAAPVTSQSINFSSC